MHRRWRRLTATALGLWFTVSVSGLALQLCPEHGGTHTMAGMGSPTEKCDPATGVPSTQHQTKHHNDSNQQSHDDCTCTGMCCVTAAVSLSTAPVVAIAVIDAQAPVLEYLPTQELAPRAAPDLTLPPPLGPPTLRA
jgi:hypothetical protein